VVTDERPGERMSDALRQRGMSTEELAWVLGISLEAVELIQAAAVIPTTALRLEAALDIPAGTWLPSAAPEALWLLAELMAGELAMIRRRRQAWSHHRRTEADWTPWN
jgi:plasmid maintenance system antidote protein VapI